MDNSKEHSNPIEVQKYLKGMDYPASKEDLISCAKDNHAPNEVMDALNLLEEDEEYYSPTDITKQMKGSTTQY